MISIKSSLYISGFNKSKPKPLLLLSFENIKKSVSAELKLPL